MKYNGSQLLFISLFFLSFIALAEEQKRPNILLFLVDDMGVMDTSLALLTDKNGKVTPHPLNDFYRTPAMEKLAKNGVTISQFYANSVCSPSRATLMTGQSSARHKTTQFIQPESKNTGKQGPKEWNWKGLLSKDITLPLLLQKDGYHTIHCGKAHFAPVGHQGENPSMLGFDTNIAGCAYGRPGSYYGKKGFGKGGSRAIPGLDQYHGKDIFLTEALTLEMNKEIAKSSRADKPFFAYMSHYAIHGPFNSDPRFADHYKNSKKPKALQAFATLVEGMDKSLQDIINQLEKSGVAEDTLIIFLGDNGSAAPAGPKHGYSSSAPLRGKKGTHFEGGMRVPFIAAWAKVNPKNKLQQQFPLQPRMIDDEFSSICDIFPTVLQLAGTPTPTTHKVDGQSLLTSFAGKRKSKAQKFLMHFPHKHSSSYFTVYREKNWKLVYHYLEKGNKRFELYNLKTDPFEKNNLAGKNIETLQVMMKAMKLELNAADAQYPIDKDSRALVPNTK